MFPYRPDAATDNPKVRLAEGPQRLRSTSIGLMFGLAVVCILLLAALLFALVVMGQR